VTPFPSALTQFLTALRAHLADATIPVETRVGDAMAVVSAVSKEVVTMELKGQTT